MDWCENCVLKCFILYSSLSLSPTLSHSFFSRCLSLKTQILSLSLSLSLTQFIVPDRTWRHLSLPIIVVFPLRPWQTGRPRYRCTNWKTFVTPFSFGRVPAFPRREKKICAALLPAGIRIYGRRDKLTRRKKIAKHFPFAKLQGMNESTYSLIMIQILWAFVCLSRNGFFCNSQKILFSSGLIVPKRLMVKNCKTTKKKSPKV